jgi:hypothetical protein
LAAYRRRTPRSGPPLAPIAGGFIVVLLVVAGGWWWFTREASPPPDWSPSPFDTTDAGMETPPPGPDTLALEDLPPLDASDEVVRRLAAALSAHPQFARWLVTDRLVDRFVGTVVDLAGGFYPGEHLPFLRPDEPFTTRTEGGRMVVAPESYRRYDLLTAVIVSVDVEGSVRLYRQLRPLVDEAWANRGLPGDPDEALALAIANLRGVSIPTASLEVLGEEGIYMYADPELEARRGAAKALMRMGPDNARRIQGRLAEFEVHLFPDGGA